MLNRIFNKDGNNGKGGKSGKSGKNGISQPPPTASPDGSGPPHTDAREASADNWTPDGGWTRDREVLGYIEANRIKALVTDWAEVAITDGVTQRHIRGIRMVVGQRIPDTRITFHRLSPILWQRYHDSIQAEKKSGSQQEAEQHVANENVTWILSRAVEAQASDIYLDIRRKVATLSFRTFGMVRQVDTMPADLGRAVARGFYSRQAGGQWEEKIPCDCSFGFRYDDREYRARCNSMPEVRGAALSCRIRDPEYTLELKEAGYSDHQVALINRICRAPGGMILISGETNSGKSTTLASLMLTAPRGQRMIELADPCEVEFDHVTHIELDHYRDDARENFRKLMAATVRQNPDSLVLGEIRDEPTAAAAQHMAIQGKRVLSTLHTQSCVAAIPRLQSLGVDRHLLSLPEFIAGIVNQNLVPVLCKECCLDKPEIPVQGLIERYAEIFGQGAELRYINPAGCPKCNHTGIVGQTLVAEVYPLGLDRKKAHQFIADDHLWMLEDYMKTEWNIQSKLDHAREKVLAGLIDPHETEAIVGEWRGPTVPETPGPHVRLVRDEKDA